MARIMLTITPEESAALGALATKERRDPRDQAALILRETLEKIGYLSPLDPETLKTEAMRYVS